MNGPNIKPEVMDQQIASVLPATGFIRLSTIVGSAGNPKKNIPAKAGLIPVSRASWYRGITEGRYPPGVRLGPNSTGWPVESIRELIESLGRTA